MALILKDRVQETCNSPGTGSVTLLGAQTGYQAFSAAIGNGNTCYYTIADQFGANWEVGLGTYSSSGNSLARTTVLASSNAGSLTNFSSGIQNVWVDYPAGKAIYTDASGNISNLAGGISTASYLDFSTSAAPTSQIGRMFWNSAFNAPVVQMDSGVSLIEGQQQYYYVKASAAITIGQVCMFTGAVGASGVLTAAPATGVTDGLVIMGLAAESIALNGFGYVQSFGILQNINTTAFTQGQILYFDPTVTGGMTATKPAMTGPQVVVASAVNINAGNGSVFIRPTYIPEISDIPGMGTGVQAALQIAVGSSGAPVLFNGALGTPNSGTLTSCTGLPITSGVSGLGTGIATWLATPNSANLLSAMTDETGSGSLVFATSPTLVTPILGTPQSGNFSTGTFTWPTFNQSTTGQAGSVANAHTAGSGLSGSSFDGSAAVSWTLATAYGDTINPYASKTAKFFLAAPNAAAGTPSFRAIVATDIPTLNQNTTGTAANVTGIVAQANGGTGVTSCGICRAWVNFNGVTTVTVAASFNVSSVVRNATGDYTVNFSTALPDANYSATGMARNQGTGVSGAVQLSINATVNPTASAFRFWTSSGWAVGSISAVAEEVSIVCVSIFR